VRCWCHARLRQRVERTELPLNALEMALWRRGIKKGSGLIHHSDRGSQPGVRGFAAPIHATAEPAGPSTAGRLRVRSLLGGGEGGQFAVDR
jgi:hypothetical protein